jgi:hypothetical protein
MDFPGRAGNQAVGRLGPDRRPARSHGRTTGEELPSTKAGTIPSSRRSGRGDSGADVVERLEHGALGERARRAGGSGRRVIVRGDGIDRVELVVDDRIDGFGFDGLLAPLEPPRIRRRGGRPVHGRGGRSAGLPLAFPGRIPEMEMAQEPVLSVSAFPPAGSTPSPPAPSQHAGMLSQRRGNKQQRGGRRTPARSRPRAPRCPNVPLIRASWASWPILGHEPDNCPPCGPWAVASIGGTPTSAPGRRRSGRGGWRTRSGRASRWSG